MRTDLGHQRIFLEQTFDMIAQKKCLTPLILSATVILAARTIDVESGEYNSLRDNRGLTLTSTVCAASIIP